MLATITSKEGKFNPNYRKEDHYLYEIAIMAIMAIMADYTVKNPVIIRIYGTQARNYSAIWAKGNGVYKSGTGTAGGYGYHRPSAAAQEAIYNAGITLDEDIGGLGDRAIKEAAEAIAKAIQPDAVAYYTHEANP